MISVERILFQWENIINIVYTMVCLKINVAQDFLSRQFWLSMLKINATVRHPIQLNRNALKKFYPSAVIFIQRMYII